MPASPLSYLPLNVDVAAKMGVRRGLVQRNRRQITMVVGMLVLLALLLPSHYGCPQRYGLMIDAGSTGSRIHIYVFSQCKNTLPELADEVFLQTRPGLSEYKNDTAQAVQSLKMLLDSAMQKVPEAQRQCTPIQVKATAGLRMLGKDTADQILREVRAMLMKDYPFPLIGKESAVEIINGENEGVFAWATINYLLDKLKAGSHGQAAVMDLGGASTQIVFLPGDENTPMPFRFDFQYDTRAYSLYQHSYLGYGVNKAMERIKLASIAQALKKDSRPGAELRRVYNPCLPEGTTEFVVVPNLNNGRVGLIGTGNAIECRDLVRSIFDKEAACHHKSCSFDGVYHPPIPDTTPVFAFSYFYDLMDPLLSEAAKLTEAQRKHYNIHVSEFTFGGSSTTSVGQRFSSFMPFTSLAHVSTINSGYQTNLATFQHFQQLMCSPHSQDFTGIRRLQNTATRDIVRDSSRSSSGKEVTALQISLENRQHPLRLLVLDLLQKDPDFCMGLTFSLELLQTGYQLGDGRGAADNGPRSRKRMIEVAKKLRGFEMGWCVGAAMSMLDTAAIELGERCPL